MIGILKNMAAEKGKELLQSPAVAKILASEQVGTVIEKAMTVPFKISGMVTNQKEKLVEMFDLATQEDVDDLRRTISRMENDLETIKEPAPADKK